VVTLLVFKIFKGFEDVSYNIYFTLSQSGLRGHSYKLYNTNPILDLILENFPF